MRFIVVTTVMVTLLASLSAFAADPPDPLDGFNTSQIILCAFQTEMAAGHAVDPPPFFRVTTFDQDDPDHSTGVDIETFAEHGSNFAMVGRFLRDFKNQRGKYVEHERLATMVDLKTPRGPNHAHRFPSALLGTASGARLTAYT